MILRGSNTTANEIVVTLMDLQFDMFTLEATKYVTAQIEVHMPNDAVAPVKTAPAAVDLRGTATFNFQKTYDASEGSELRTAISAALCDGDGGYCSEDSSDGGRYRLTLVRFVVRAEQKDSGKWVEVGEAQVCLGAMFGQCEMAEELEDPEMDPRNGCPQWLKVQGEGDGLKEWGQGMFTSEPSGELLGVVNAMPVLEAIRKALQEGDADSESDAPSSQPSQSVSLPSCFLESSFRSKAEYEASLLLPDAERAAAEAAAGRGLMPSAPPLRLLPDGGGDGGGGDGGGRAEGGDEGGGGEGDGGDGRGGDRGGRVEGGEDDGGGEGGDGGPGTICGELKPKDKVYFIGNNYTLPNGNKLRHGQQGEVVSQGAFAGDVVVLFAGNRETFEVLFGLLSREPPPRRELEVDMGQAYNQVRQNPIALKVRQKDRLDAAHQRELEAKTSECFSIQPVLDCLTKCVRCIEPPDLYGRLN